MNTQDETASSRSQNSSSQTGNEHFCLDPGPWRWRRFPPPRLGCGIGTWTLLHRAVVGSDHARPVHIHFGPACPPPSDPREPRDTLGLLLGYKRETTGEIEKQRKIAPNHPAPQTQACAFACVVTEAGSASTSAFRDWAALLLRVLSRNAGGLCICVPQSQG